MSTIFLQEPLQEQDLAALRSEFPHYRFTDEGLTPDVEIIYGQHFDENELVSAVQLKWIHSTAPFFDNTTLKSIETLPNTVLLSETRGNIDQLGEYVMANILAFSKNLFLWKNSENCPSELKESMWLLKEKTLLQVGLGVLGKEITRRAQQLELKTWGLSTTRSVHPYCHKTFMPSNLHSLLPNADIICIAAPPQDRNVYIFKKTELKLLKDDAILIIMGSRGIINEDDLYDIAESGKLRGIIIDTFEYNAVPDTSPLRKLPNTVITNEIAKLPTTDKHLAFRTFRYNLSWGQSFAFET
jgi:phosphoglycerate dehydrogenase-like enzyme